MVEVPPVACLEASALGGSLPCVVEWLPAAPHDLLLVLPPSRYCCFSCHCRCITANACHHYTQMQSRYYGAAAGESNTRNAVCLCVTLATVAFLRLSAEAGLPDAAFS